MPSPFTDLDRPPLREAALRRSLVDGGLWTDIRVLATSPSTNAHVTVAARAGAPQGLVVVAEAQTAGRGRQDRTWTSPARAGLTFSVVLRPDAPAATWGWLPLLAGLAVANSLGELTDLDVRLKWPNDVLVGDHKVGGLLSEVVDSAVVVGVGINVSLRLDELPVPTATSLAIEGSLVLDREPLLRATLREMARRYEAWGWAGGDPAASGLRAAYQAACTTIGRAVQVELPGGRVLAGRAMDVDANGRLVVAAGSSEEAVGAGDVVQVR